MKLQYKTVYLTVMDIYSVNERRTTLEQRMSDEMNRLGQEGWEYSDYMPLDNWQTIILIFKRDPKNAPPDKA